MWNDGSIRVWVIGVPIESEKAPKHSSLIDLTIDKTRMRNRLLIMKCPSRYIARCKIQSVIGPNMTDEKCLVNGRLIRQLTDYGMPFLDLVRPNWQRPYSICF